MWAEKCVLTPSIWKPQSADEQDRYCRITFPCNVEKCDEHILATKLAKKNEDYRVLRTTSGKNAGRMGFSMGF